MSERRYRSLAIAAAVVSVLHAGALNFVVSNHQSTDTFRYVADAKSLLHGRYAAPIFDDGTGPIAPEVARTPGYPLFLAAFGGGGRGASRIAVLLAQTLIVGATTLILIAAVRRMWTPEVALVAGWLFALDPFSKRYATVVLSETVATLCIVLLLYATVRTAAERSFSWWPVAAGVAGGLATLVRPALALGVLFSALAAALVGRAEPSRRVVQALVVVVAGVITVSPWLVRNEVLTGRPVLGGWGDGAGLAIAADGEGASHSVDDIVNGPMFVAQLLNAKRLLPSPAEVSRSPDRYPRALVRADARLRRDAWATFRRRVSGEPLTVLGEYAYRAYAFWMPYTDPIQYRPARLLPFLKTLDLAALAFAVLGAAIAVRRRHVAVVIVAFLVAFMLESAVFHVEARYSQPVRPLFLTLAAAALVAVAAAVYRRPPLREPDTPRA